MLMDKFAWARQKGHWFALFGLGNLACYGLSLFSMSETYQYHFAYEGTGRMWQPLRSMIGSEKLANVAWTAPALIIGGTYLQGKLGVLATSKFFAMALMSTYLFTCCFGPRTFFGDIGLRSYVKPFLGDFDCVNEKTKTMIGADGMACSVIYMILFYHRLWAAGAVLATADIAYYGLYGAGAPVCAGLAALTLL